MASLDVIIKQMILSAFRSAMMDSASPGHINRFKGMEGGEMDIIGSNEELNAAIREAVEQVMANPENAESLSDEITSAGEKTGKNKELTEGQATGLVRTGISGAQNPAGLATMLVQFMPHAVLITLALSLAPIIFEILTKPGGPLDLRFKRIIDDEINAFLSRQTQKDTEMGVRQVIIQSKLGFTASNAVSNYNTQKGIREGGFDKERLDRLGRVDHSKGLFDFG